MTKKEETSDAVTMKELVLKMLENETLNADVILEKGSTKITVDVLITKIEVDGKVVLDDAREVDT